MYRIIKDTSNLPADNMFSICKDTENYSDAIHAAYEQAKSRGESVIIVNGKVRTARVFPNSTTEVL